MGGALARFASAALAVACAALLVAGSAIAAPPTEVGTIDGSGSGAGSFAFGFFDVAVDEASGDVYVLDNGNDTIARFHSDGEFVSELKGSETDATTFGFSSNRYDDITVDNSGGAGQGDVYVVSSGPNTVFRLDFEGTPSEVWEAGTLADPCGVAVNQDGEVWVTDFEETDLLRISPDDGSLTGDTIPLQGDERCDLAFDNDGAAYVGGANFEKYAEDGSTITVDPSPTVTLAVAASFSRNDVFSTGQSGGPRIRQWDKSGGSISEIQGVSGANAFFGVALDGVRNQLYVADLVAGVVRVYTVPAQPPTVVAAPVSDVTPDGVTLHASVNPNGSDLTDCHAEYLTEAQFVANGEHYTGATTVPCAPSAPISGTDDVQISAVVAGLEPDTAYRSRFVATNDGDTSQGNDVLFTTEAIDPPGVTTGLATAVTQTGATLSGTVNSNGFATSCKFQYGTSTSYGSEVAATDPGSGSGAVDVNAPVGGLNANTDYHFRLVCTNGGGTSNGSDVTFKTLAAVITNPPPPPKPPIEENSGAYASCVKQANAAAKKAKKAAKKKKGKAKAKAIKAANKKRAKAVKACKARYL